MWFPARPIATNIGIARASHRSYSLSKLTFEPKILPCRPSVSVRIFRLNRSEFVNLSNHFKSLIRNLLSTSLTFGTGAERTGIESPTCLCWHFVLSDIFQFQTNHPPDADCQLGSDAKLVAAVNLWIWESAVDFPTQSCRASIQILVTIPNTSLTDTGTWLVTLIFRTAMERTGTESAFCQISRFVPYQILCIG